MLIAVVQQSFHGANELTLKIQSFVSCIIVSYDTAVSMILVVFSFDSIVNKTSQNMEINFGDIAQKGQFIFEISCRTRKVEMDFDSSNLIPSYPKVQLHNSREMSSFFYRICLFCFSFFT